MIKKTLFAVCLLTLSACSQKADVTTNTSEKINLSDLHGKWLVVNYWAKWCSNCKNDMHDFDQFFQAYQDQVIVLGVNYDGIDTPSLNAIQKEWRISFPQTAHFPIERFGINHIDSLPRTYVFSPDGKLRKTLYGPQTVRKLASAIDITKGKAS